MKFINLLSLFLLVTFTTPAVMATNGWTSGGGDNLKEHFNPWFLDNVETVNYCIDIDKKSISMDATMAEKVVDKAIADWKTIFAKYQKNHPDNKVILGTQTWIKQDCQNNTQLKFKFGWNTLNYKQKKFLSHGHDPKDSIASAVRTFYSKKNLYGRGFIYVASDIGQHQLNIEDDQIKTPWRYPVLLYLVLMHELGHVYGMPHISSSLVPLTERWLMSKYFPEMVLRKILWKNNNLSTNFPLMSIQNIFDSTQYQSCSMDKLQQQWSLDSKINCLEIEFVGDASFPSEIEVKFLDSDKMVYKANLEALTWSDVLTKSDITIYLPKQQTLFNDPQYKAFPVVSGPGITTGYYSGTLTLPSGKTKKLLLVKEKSGLKIIGVDLNLKTISPISTILQK